MQTALQENPQLSPRRRRRNALRSRRARRIHHNPQEMTDEGGNTVWSADYRPFGQVTLLANEISNPLRRPGQLEDDETGYFYNWFRTLDPATGRYLQSDPIGLWGGLNTYTYAANRPIVLIDPDGREIKCVEHYGDPVKQTLMSEDFVDVKVIECKSRLGVWPDAPSPSDRGRNPRGILPFGLDVIVTCEWKYRREKVTPTVLDTWYTRSRWEDCEDTCDGRKWRVYYPDERIP